eukprot:5574170-Pyramimonas_sp.AAC.1
MRELQGARRGRRREHMLPQGWAVCGETRLEIDQHRGRECPEGELLRLRGCAEAGLACQCMAANQMEYWLEWGWSDRQIRH